MAQTPPNSDARYEEGDRLEKGLETGPEAGPEGDQGTGPAALSPRRSLVRVRPMALVPARRSWITRGAIWTFDGIVITIVLGALALFALADRELTAPGWLTEQVSTRLDAGLPGADLTIERMSLRMGRFAAPRLQLHAITLTSPDTTARQLLRIPMAEIGLQGKALLQGQVLPSALTVTGARLVVARDADGQFDLGFGEAPAREEALSLPELLRTLDGAFDQPALAALRTIRATQISVALQDARAGRAWSVENGRITLTRSEEELRLAAALTLPGAAPQGPGGDMLLPEAEVILTASRDGARASVAGRLEGFPAADLAAQSRGLTWLAPLRAPVSGALRADLEADGSLGPVSAKLEIGAGTLTLGPTRDPIPFEMARTYFTYAPEAGRLTFEEVLLRSDTATFSGTAQALLQANPEHPEQIDHIVAQIQSQDLTLDPAGVFAEPQSFGQAATDLRITLAPLVVDIGQVTLRREAEGEAEGVPLQVIAFGRAALRPDGWHTAVDVTVPRADQPQVAGLWPLPVAPRTRAWVLEHIIGGEVQDFRAALRFDPDGPPRRQLTWRFAQMALKPLPDFPPITGGSGFAALTGPDFTVTLEAGRAAAPGAGPVNLSGMSFRIPDSVQEPPMAMLGLRAEGQIADVLALVDQPPLSLLRDLPEGVILADAGRVRVSGDLAWPLERGVRLSGMDLALSAELTEVSAASLVPGHVLTADTLTLRADPELLTVSGAARLSNMPINAVFARPLGAGRDRNATVEGTAQISMETLAAFGIALPPGSLRGTGVADVFVDLPDGGARPSLRLVSDLNRLGVSIPALGWSKPQAGTGTFVLETELGPGGASPTLLLDAPGLVARGRVLLAPDGSFTGMDLSRVQAGGWLDAPISLRAPGPGQAPQVTLQGGRLRLANLPSGGQASTGSAPIRLRDMRLDISDNIALTDLSGDITSVRGGLSGAFTARVGGAAPIRGQLAPDPNGRGTAIRLTGADAGGVLRAAGLFDRANDGELSLVLRPVAERVYDGTLNVSGTRVTSASGLTTLLNAISIVGLLDQMAGPGILFTSIDADFRLTPTALQVRQGSGVGPSMGISMRGVYDLQAERLDMQGVVSPVYVLNSIGQIFSRRGEGLFGFNYRMTGSAQAPQVSVNPLSVLTPGMFRDLFRAPPPELPAQ